MDEEDGKIQLIRCGLDNEPCVADAEGYGRCGDLVAECLWAEERDGE